MASRLSRRSEHSKHSRCLLLDGGPDCPPVQKLDQDIGVGVVNHASCAGRNLAPKPKLGGGFSAQRFGHRTAHLTYLRGERWVKLRNLLRAGGENIGLAHLRGEMAVKNQDTALLCTLTLNLVRDADRIAAAVILRVCDVDDNRWETLVTRGLTRFRCLHQPAPGYITSSPERFRHLCLALCARLNPEGAILRDLPVRTGMRVQHIAYNRHGTALVFAQEGYIHWLRR